MSTSERNSELIAIGLVMMEDGFAVIVSDGRHYHVPYSCYPRLESASPEERANFEVCAHGRLLHWTLIDEDISVEHIMQGKFPVKSPNVMQFVAESRPCYGKNDSSDSIVGYLKGQSKIDGDIVAPIGEKWDADED